MATEVTLQEQVDKILREVEQAGLKTNFFFKTTLSRYLQQLSTLGKLKKEMDAKEFSVIVSKEYVKGRPAIVMHPAIDSFNKTSTAANNTVTALINILERLKGDEPDKRKGMTLLDEALSKLARDLE